MRVRKGMRGLIIDEGHLSSLGYADSLGPSQAVTLPPGPAEASLPHGSNDPNILPWLGLAAGTAVLMGIGYLLAHA